MRRDTVTVFKMLSEMKDFQDIALIIFLALLCIPFVLLSPLNETPIRMILGLLLVLFLPGYSLIAVLFPRKEDLDWIERMALSFGLSIAIVPLLGLALNYTPFGIRLTPILLVLAICTVIFAISAYVRRRRIPKEQRFFVDFRAALSVIRDAFSNLSLIDRILTIFLLISIILAISALIYVIITPKVGERFTEFYILGEEGKAAGYPTNLSVGQNATVIIGIANHEYRRVNYTVEIWLVNASYEDNQTMIHEMFFLDAFSVALNHTDVNVEGNWTPQFEKPYTFSINKAGKFKIWFLLFKEAQEQKFERERNYAGTEVERRIHDAIEGKIQSLNLNIFVEKAD